MKILALDIATKTGWCTEHASGVWNLAPKKDESKGMALLRLRAKLLEVIELEKITVVVFERPAGQHKAPIISQSEKHGVVKLVCEDLKIHYKAYSAPEIKKHATGKGRANKAKMIEAAKAKWPDVDIKDDNQADAMWIYDLCVSEFESLI